MEEGKQGSKKKYNRLIGEKSPYLLQHATNPVDWYPWGDEAFERARRDEKPIFLSIGYSTCHWCHVMERESFEDQEAAELLNEAFVAIKVDREERPDIDADLHGCMPDVDRERRLATYDYDDAGPHALFCGNVYSQKGQAWQARAHGTHTAGNRSMEDKKG